MTLTFRSNKYTTWNRGALIAVLCTNSRGGSEKKEKGTRNTLHQADQDEPFKLLPVAVHSSLCVFLQMYYFGGRGQHIPFRIPFQLPSDENGNEIRSNTLLPINPNSPIRCVSENMRYPTASDCSMYALTIQNFLCFHVCRNVWEIAQFQIG